MTGSYKIAVLPGDGIGPEIAESVVNWFAAAREPRDWRGETLRAWQAAALEKYLAEHLFEGDDE